MEYRTFSRTGWNVSAIGFGAWGIGGNEWGPTDDKTSLATLNQAVDLGVNFFDTADVYGDGHSEQLIAQVRKARSEPIIVATMAQFALRWILLFPEVSSTIPGAKNPQQIKDNVQTIELSPLSDEAMQRVREIYDTYIRVHVHNRW